MSFIQLVHHLGSWGSHWAKAQFASRRGGFLFHGCLHTETEGSIDESGSPLLHKEGLGMVKSPRISPVLMDLELSLAPQTSDKAWFKNGLWLKSFKFGVNCEAKRPY
jgi:hypothetical protein